MGLAFWGQVNRLIKERGLKQEWLAARTGINYQTLRGQS
jgi:hypothetical protein